ncbi:MAG: hypothetical protein WA364_07645 [Candidatus Nitrosopolaris sp.]
MKPSKRQVGLIARTDKILKEFEDLGGVELEGDMHWFTNEG